MSTVPAETLQKLRAAADGARRLNYSPHSNFLVLAAAETVTGSVGGGSNVENANLTLTKHAEELAIIGAFRAGAEPPRPGTLRYVYVAGPAPCGSCRQFAAEFAASDACWILEPVEQRELRGGRLVDRAPTGAIEVVRFTDALPFAFELPR